MPAIPESTRSSIILRLLDHAEKHWPQLKKVQASYRGSFADHPGACRRDHPAVPPALRRLGDPSGFAIYSAARGRYEDGLLRTGLPTGTPQEALDTACTIHLTGARARTPTLTPDELTGTYHLAAGVRCPSHAGQDEGTVLRAAVGVARRGVRDREG